MLLLLFFGRIKEDKCANKAVYMLRYVAHTCLVNEDTKQPKSQEQKDIFLRKTDTYITNSNSSKDKQRAYQFAEDLETFVWVFGKICIVIATMEVFDTAKVSERISSWLKLFGGGRIWLNIDVFDWLETKFGRISNKQRLCRWIEFKVFSRKSETPSKSIMDKLQDHYSKLSIHGWFYLNLDWCIWLKYSILQYYDVNQL